MGIDTLWGESDVNEVSTSDSLCSYTMGLASLAPLSFMKGEGVVLNRSSLRSSLKGGRFSLSSEEVCARICLFFRHIHHLSPPVERRFGVIDLLLQLLDLLHQLMDPARLPRDGVLILRLPYPI